MTSQALLWITIGVGLFIALIFRVRSSQKQPSRLKMTSGTAIKSESKDLGPVVKNPNPFESISNETVEAAGEGAPIKSLNVIFNYNGHSWDAYEVLGIPAGAPPKMVNEALETALKNALPESHEFLRRAHQCILNSKRA